MIKLPLKLINRFLKINNVEGVYRNDTKHFVISACTYSSNESILGTCLMNNITIFNDKEWIQEQIICVIDLLSFIPIVHETFYVEKDNQYMFSEIDLFNEDGIQIRITNSNSNSITTPLFRLFHFYEYMYETEEYNLLGWSNELISKYESYISKLLNNYILEAGLSQILWRPINDSLLNDYDSKCLIDMKDRLRCEIQKLQNNYPIEFM